MSLQSRAHNPCGSPPIRAGREIRGLLPASATAQSASGPPASQSPSPAPRITAHRQRIGILKPERTQCRHTRLERPPRNRLVSSLRAAAHRCASFRSPRSSPNNRHRHRRRRPRTAANATAEPRFLLVAHPVSRRFEPPADHPPPGYIAPKNSSPPIVIVAGAARGHRQRHRHRHDHRKRSDPQPSACAVSTPVLRRRQQRVGNQRQPRPPRCTPSGPAPSSASAIPKR